MAIATDLAQNTCAGARAEGKLRKFAKTCKKAICELNISKCRNGISASEAHFGGRALAFPGGS